MLYNLSLIEKACRGKKEAKEKMLETFKKSSTKAVQEIKQAAQDEDFELMRAAAHSIKPVFAMYAIITLEKSIHYIEHFNEGEDNLEILNEAILKTEQTIEEINTELSLIINTN